jgi:hypothetical protein
MPLLASPALKRRRLLEIGTQWPTTGRIKRVVKQEQVAFSGDPAAKRLYANVR